MRIRDTCCLLALLALLGIGAARAQSPNDYAARWPLQVAGDSPAWQLEVGEEVFAALQDPGFGDLQVFNAAGAAVPTARANTATSQAPRWLQARFANSGPADGAAGDAGVMSYAYVVPAQLTVEAARVALGTAAPAANLALQYQQGDSWNHRGAPGRHERWRRSRRRDCGRRRPERGPLPAGADRAGLAHAQRHGADAGAHAAPGVSAGAFRVPGAGTGSVHAGRGQPVVAAQRAGAAAGTDPAAR